MNKVQLTGRITRDPELRSTANGVSVCSFTIAVNRRFKNAEGKYEADFISCVAWRGTADFVSKYFKKGDPIEIVGSIQTRNYENNEGQRVYITEVLCEEVGFALSSKKDDAQSNTASSDAPVNNPFANAEDFSMEGFMPAPADDDLPF